LPNEIDFGSGLVGRGAGRRCRAVGTQPLAFEPNDEYAGSILGATMPLLWGDAIVGWANVSMNAGAMESPIRLHQTSERSVFLPGAGRRTGADARFLSL